MLDLGGVPQWAKYVNRRNIIWLMVDGFNRF
jgi:hypothetical protein